MSNDDSKNLGTVPRKRATIIKRSGIEILDRIYDLEKEGPAFGVGHYVPDIWTRVFLDERGRPHWLAMMVFGEIWFRHRPREAREIRDSGEKVITLSKGFTADRYQFNRGEMAARLNTSPDAISRSLTYMEKLGVINREHEDTDINHRGFRNLVYVTPIVDKLLELVAEAEKIVNKDRPNPEVEENAHNSERRDVGNVTHMTPAISPASSRQRDPHNVGDVGPMMGGVSKESSKVSSLSSVFAAAPQNTLKENNNKNSSAPQAAQPDADDAALENCDWSAPPPKPTGKDGAFGSDEEKVKTIRYRIGKSYRTWYGRKPNLSAQIFEDLLLENMQELQWKCGKFTTVILAGWLWANDAPEKKPDKTFIPGFYTKKCDNSLQTLFKRDTKEKKLYIWHIEQELIKQAGGQYDIDIGNMTREEVNLWWDQEMMDRGVIRDETKYYDAKGRELRDPVATTWTGIRKDLEGWQSFHPTDGKPEQEWFEAVIRRLKVDANATNIHRIDYEAVKKTIEGLGMIPADFQQD